jgi:hypothetical protein
MPRPTGVFGLDQPYLAATGQTIFDTDPASLPPVTRAVRQAFTGASPVPSADAMAAILVAIKTLEDRVVVLEP